MTKPITSLRQRMIDDMALRNMSPATQRVYISAVKNFSAFFGQSRDQLTFEDVRTYNLFRGKQATSFAP
jgi:integrase/recombinase XerD